MTESATPVRGASIARASAGQRQLWMHDRLYAHDGSYNILLGLRLDGRLDVALLRRALAAVVSRQEALRTSLLLEADDVVQVIAEDVDVEIPLVDLTAQTEAHAFHTIQAALERDGAQPFDLAVAPLFRVRVFRVAPEIHAMTLVVHHSVFDGWSVGVLLDELGTCYDDLQGNRAISLPPLDIQYADFAEWHWEQLELPSAKTSVDYWRERLAGAPPRIELPTDRPRGRASARRGRLLVRQAPHGIRDAAVRLGRTENVTLFVVLTTGWITVLHRYSRQRDLVIGTPVAGRVREELEPLIGDFINTVLVRSSIEPDTTFQQLLGQLRTHSLEAQTHQSVPFEQLRDLVTTPGMAGDRFELQALLALQSATPEPRSFGGLRPSLFWGHSGTAKADLFLNLVDDSSGLRFELEFDTDLFDECTANRLLDSYALVLAHGAAHPTHALARMPLVGETDRRLMARANATATTAPQPEAVHTLFENQASRTPSQVAVIFGERQRTYAEINDRANQIASVLRAKGAGPDVLVGICVPRSDDMVAAVLGVLKSGSAYVPIDPAYPADRIALVLEDAAAPLLITDSTLLAGLPHTTANLVVLDQLAPEQVVAPAVAVTAEQLAYVIYTSGSTGRPKGVEIPHRAFVNFLLSMQREPGFTASDRLLAVTTLSFDIAGLELLLPLVTGGSLVMVPTGAAMDPARIRALLSRWHITVLQATPITFRLLLDSGWQGDPALRVLCGGEALPPDLAAALRPACAELWNMYGPTETTVWSLLRKIDTAQIDIGHPIDNTDIVIVDEAGEPVPVGVPGELLIGGLGLARGYHNRADLTADRFIAHPQQPGQRAYRTGDLARWRSDGQIDCLGRLDFQVKIRGFRIELGEIESVLLQQPGIAQAVVVAREDRPGDKRLVAYITPTANSTPAVDTLRSALARQLPDYMVPATFVTIATLPLTPNGKVDRKALPAPESRAAVQGETRAAQTDTERQLAGIWQDVLNLPAVGVRDQFFDIGGHSLAALRVFTRVETTFGVALPLSALLDGPTVEQLAKTIDDVRTGAGARTWPALVNIKPGAGPALFCIHSLSGDVLEYRDIARHLPEGQRVVGVQAVLDDDLEARYSGIQSTARFYLEEIRSAQPSGPYYLCGWSSGATLAYEMAQQLKAAHEEVALLAVIDAAPVNVTSTRRRSGLRRWWLQVANIPAWIRGDILETSLTEVSRRIRHKASVWFRRFGRGRTPLTVRDIVNFPQRTGRWEAFAQHHFHAFIGYVPRKFDGRVSVFTAPTHPLLRLNDPVPDWQELATDVDVYAASGTHFSIVKEPHVQVVAQRLAEAIAKAQRHRH